MRICTDLGLKDVQEYAQKLMKAEKAKEVKEQVIVFVICFVWIHSSFLFPNLMYIFIWFIEISCSSFALSGFREYKVEEELTEDLGLLLVKTVPEVVRHDHMHNSMATSYPGSWLSAPPLAGEKRVCTFFR